MSKTVDTTVNRNQLFETLEETILPDEIHLLHILTNDVKLKVRVGAEYGPEFTTSVWIIQGDYLFIFYLAKALSSRPPLETERYIAILVHLDSHVKHQPKCWITRILIILM